jgi:hypothetical protein
MQDVIKALEKVVGGKFLASGKYPEGWVIHFLTPDNKVHETILSLGDF